MQIKEIEPNKGIDELKVEIIELDEPREFTDASGREGKLVNAKIKDATGETKMTLWDKQVDQVRVNDEIVIENGWAKDYKGETQVGLGKFGTLTVIKK